MYICIGSSILEKKPSPKSQVILFTLTKLLSKLTVNGTQPVVVGLAFTLTIVGGIYTSILKTPKLQAGLPLVVCDQAPAVVGKLFDKLPHDAHTA